MKMALGRIPVSRKMGKDVLSRMLRVSSTKERQGKAGTNLGCGGQKGNRRRQHVKSGDGAGALCVSFCYSKTW